LDVITSVAMMSGGASLQELPVQLSLYCRRYVWPMIEFHVTSAMPFVIVTLWIIKGGGGITGSTRTRNELVALKGGEPSSTTRVVIVLVLGLWVSFGTQVIMPFASIAAPLGALSRLYVSVFAGMSGSVAVLVTVRVVSLVMVRSG